MSKRIVVDGKIYTEYTNKLIRYDGDIYYENAPNIWLKGRSRYRDYAIKELIEDDPGCEVSKSAVRKVRAKEK